jgi:uncharacterized protein (TIGR02147 family)
MKKREEKKGIQEAQKTKPDIFMYHDYREYLKDRMDFERQSQSKFSLRMLAAEVKLAPGYLPMVLAGTRGISSEVLERVGLVLGLSKDEQKYLQGLRTIVESQSQNLRLEALEELQRHRVYREKNPKELEVHQYLTHWFNLAIREMVNLEDFQIDAKWIRNKLRVKIPLNEVQKALDFLFDKGFIEKLPNGKARVLDRKLECVGNIYRLVLAQFHREMLKLASDALETVPHGERSIVGLTFPIPVSRYGEVAKILDETLDRIDALSTEAKGSDSVYHVGVSLFPLTHNKRGKS